MAILLLLFAASAGMAEETVYQIEGTVVTGTVEGGISNDAALEGFINRAFGIGSGSRRGVKKAPQATRRSTLYGQDAVVYDLLYQCISEVAAGDRESTVFKIPVAFVLEDQYQTAYTAADLGVEAVVVDNAITEDAKNAMVGMFEYDFSLIMDALLADCPYELYWFDKTSQFYAGYPGLGASYDGNEWSVYFAAVEGDTEPMLSFTLKVAMEYSVGGATVGTTVFDTGVATAIEAAAANAQSIVTSNRAKSDWDKLKAFKNAVCNWVDYNHSAAENDDTPYGNPWQLVWVFDGDPDTKVVCEGYSKAFKYLCDQSNFRTSVSVAIVSGIMEGGTGAGRHMWNLVTMGDGNRYLVDVTNCDSDSDGSVSVGYPDLLFMVGYKAHEPGSNTYRYISSDSAEGISYTYDSEMANLYSEEELAVNEEDFDPNANPDALNKGQCGDSLNWELRGSLLVIRGSGSMYDFAAGESPWYQMSAITSVDLGGATSIGTYAFEGCANLSSVALPMELTAVGANAFSGCASLASVEYPGTQAQKAEISIGSGNEKLTAAEWQCGKLSKPKFSGIDHGTFVGSDFTAHIIVPSGAAMVYWEFGKVVNDQLEPGPWDEISSGMIDQIRVLGFNTSEPGTYRLRAQAWTHDQYLEEPAEDDSEWAIYEFTLTAADLPAISQVELSATEVAVRGTVTYTVQGAEAVTCQEFSVDERSDWGTNPPSNYTEGESETITMRMPGQTCLRIWARFNGVWSQPVDQYVYVEPLGILAAPEVTWNDAAIERTLRLAPEDPMTFSVYAPGVSYIWYTLDLNTEGTFITVKDGGDSGSELVIDLADFELTPGQYRLTVGGEAEQDGWLCETAKIWLRITDGTLFKVEDGMITEYGGSTLVTELVIPSTYEGQTITAIGDFVFEGMKQLKTVTLPGTLTSVEMGAFFECPLTSVNVPAGVETKKWYFYERGSSGNPRVYSVDLPKSVTDADDAAFFCTKLPTVSPDFVTPSGLKTIDAEAFAGTSPTFVWLSDGVTSIGSGAFSGCSGLKLVRIPDGCEIGPNAFPAGTILCVEWNSEGETYAQNNGYDLIYYVEGFNG